ncbi:MAG: hypothetical protein GY937_27725 [bacterium]|nr:hypothetical protein [bacterium]
MRSFFHDPLRVAAAVLLLLAGLAGGAGALSQIGQPFPGFLVLENRVVASVGLSLWPGTAGGEIYQHEITAIDGERTLHVNAIRAIVAESPIGTELAYSFRGSEGSFERSIATRHFGWRDATLLHGLYLLNGLALGIAALIALGARDRNDSAMAVAPILLVAAVWALTAMDIYGPYRTFRVHALAETLLPACALHMALCFPTALGPVRRRPWLVVVPYILAGFLAAANQWGLRTPSVYTTTHLVAVSAIGVALVVFVVSEVERYRRPLVAEVRARLRTVALGCGVALLLPVVITLFEFVTGGRSPQNAIALTGFILPLSLAWAVRGESFPEPMKA